MLQQYTPIYQLTPEELQELRIKSNCLVEGQKAIILSTGRAVLASECRPTANTCGRQTLLG